jgi:hypothetical protein
MNNNNAVVLIQWLAVAHRSDLRWDKPSTGRFFSLMAQPSFSRSLGIPENYAVTPYLLTPRDSFYMLASRDLPDAAFTGEQRHLPYRLKLHGREAEIISIVSRLYPMGIQTVRITARLELDPTAGYGELLHELQSLRKPHSVPSADHIVRMAFALATGDRAVDIRSLTYKTYFGMQISLPTQDDQMPTLINKHRASIIALLISDSHQPRALTAEIIDRITKQNQRINEKSSFEYLMENPLGLVYLVPKEGYASPHPERFRRSVDIAEMALYARYFLDYSSDERRRNENLVDFLLAKIETWISVPPVIFSTSMTSRLEWEVLSDAYSFPSSLEQWKKYQGIDSADRSKADLFRNVPADWYRIPDFARFLADLGTT